MRVLIRFSATRGLRSVVVACILLGAALTLVLSGCGRGSMVDERNIYYIRGMKLRDQKRHEDAEAAFNTCLRLSPESAKAHLQLALLYEDALDDPLRCVYHYRMYLEMRPDDPHAVVVRTWLARAEDDLLDALQLTRSSGGGPAPATVRRPPSSDLLPEHSTGDVVDDDVPSLMDRLRGLATVGAGAKQKVDRAVDEGGQPQSGGEDLSPRAERTRGDLPVTAAPPPRPADSSQDATPASQAQLRLHHVKGGESLSALSRRYYGHLRYWPMLRDYNRDVLRGGETLRVGMTLRIPPLTTLTAASERAPGSRDDEGKQ